MQPVFCLISAYGREPWRNVGEDLDVLLELCDRIMVINGGAVTGIVDARTATKEEIGLLMTRTAGRKEEEA